MEDALEFAQHSALDGVILSEHGHRHAERAEAAGAADPMQLIREFNAEFKGDKLCLCELGKRTSRAGEGDPG